MANSTPEKNQYGEMPPLPAEIAKELTKIVESPEVKETADRIAIILVKKHYSEQLGQIAKLHYGGDIDGAARILAGIIKEVRDGAFREIAMLEKQKEQKKRNGE